MSLIKELLQHFDDTETRLKASPVVEPALAHVQECIHELEAIYEEAEIATAAAVAAAEHKAHEWLAAKIGHQPTPLPAMGEPAAPPAPAG